MAAATSPRVPELEFLWFAQGKNMTSGGEPQSISGRWRLLPSPPRRQGHGGWATRLQSRTLDAKSTGVRFNVLCVLVIPWSLTTAPMWKALAITDIAIGRDRLAKGVGRWR